MKNEFDNTSFKVNGRNIDIFTYLRIHSFFSSLATEVKFSPGQYLTFLQAVKIGYHISYFICKDFLQNY